MSMMQIYIGVLVAIGAIVIIGLANPLGIARATEFLQDRGYSVVFGESSSAWTTDVEAIGSNVGDHDTINDAVTAIGSTQTTLIISEATTVSTSVTVPDNIEVRVIGPGSISVAGGQTLTIEGVFNAPGPVFSGAGSVAMHDMNGTVNARWFGMEETASAATNATAINKALAATSNGAGTNANCVELPNGIYSVGATITMDTRGQCLVGMPAPHQGRPDISNNSHVLLDFTMTDASNGIEIVNCSACGVLNISLEFDRTGGHTGNGIDVLNSPYARPFISGVSIMDAGNDCIHMVDSWDTTIRDNYLFNCANYGFYYEGGGSVYFISNNVTATDVEAVHISNGDGLVIQNNEIANNARGINLDDSSNSAVVVDGNFFEDNDVYNIKTASDPNSSDNLRITSNVLDGLDVNTLNVILGNATRDFVIGWNHFGDGAPISAKDIASAGDRTQGVVFQRLATEIDINVDSSDVAGSDDDTHWGIDYTVTYIDPANGGMYTQGAANLSGGEGNYQQLFKIQLRSQSVTSGTTIDWRTLRSPLVYLDYAAPTTLTDITNDGNFEGLLYIVCANANGTVGDGTGIELAGDAAFVCGGIGDVLTLTSYDGTWYEASRSAN